MSIAVIYIARFADGPQLFQDFVDSYRRHPAGMDHTLYVALKGCANPEDVQKVRHIFAPVPHVLHEMPDTGFCKGSVLNVARAIQEDHICSISTTGTIETDDWLAKLYTSIQEPGAGIVGASASYQSISATMLFKGELFRRSLIDPGFKRRCLKYYPFLMERYSFKSHLRHPVYYHRRFKQQAEENAFIQAAFPGFPNPHIRTTAYMLRRDFFTRLCSIEPKTKWDVLRLESSHIGLTRQLLREGYKAIVVGKNGTAYGIADWAQSNTFRIGNQDNLLVADKRVKMFAACDEPERLGWTWVSWGDYADLSYPSDMPVTSTRVSRLPPIDLARGTSP